MWIVAPYWKEQLSDIPLNSSFFRHFNVLLENQRAIAGRCYNATEKEPLNQLKDCTNPLKISASPASINAKPLLFI